MATTPNILILLPALGFGGAERLCVALCHSAVSAGMIVTLAAKTGPLADSLPTDPNFTFVDLDLKTKGLIKGWSAYHQLNKIIRKSRPDLIHSHSRWPSWLGRRLAEKHGLGFITTAHNVHGHNNFIKRIYSRIQQHGQPWIAVSAFVADTNAALFPKFKDHVACLPIGADQNRLAGEKELATRGHAFRRKHKIGEQDCLLVVPSRISALYDNKLIIDALCQISHNNPVLLYNGGHKNQRALDRLADQAKALPANVRLIIEQNDADFLPALATADLCLSIAAKAAAFGMVISEAQSLGCPVFATALGGATEQIDNAPADDLGSRLIDAANATDLAAKLQDFLLHFDPSRRSTRIDSKSVAQLRQQFNLDAHLDGTLDIYRETAKHI